jgi:hypothetical protein
MCTDGFGFKLRADDFGLVLQKGFADVLGLPDKACRIPPLGGPADLLDDIRYAVEILQDDQKTFEGCLHFQKLEQIIEFEGRCPVHPGAGGQKVTEKPII